MLGDVDWDSISPLLKQLEASARNSQLELDPCAHVADICDKHPISPFSDSLQKHLTANLRDNLPSQEALDNALLRSEEHTSELQSLMRISYAVFCLKKKKYKHTTDQTNNHYQTT